MSLHDTKDRPASCRIYLDQDHAEALRVLLDQSVRELSYEIASADVPSYRRMLRERRETLRQILNTIGGPIQRRKL